MRDGSSTPLQNDKYVFTKSEGEEPFRHVVIALKEGKSAEREDRDTRRERTAGSEKQLSQQQSGIIIHRSAMRRTVRERMADFHLETKVNQEGAE